MSLSRLKDRLQLHGDNQGGCLQSKVRSFQYAAYKSRLGPFAKNPSFTTDTVQAKQQSIARITTLFDITLSAVVRMTSSLAEIQKFCGGNARQSQAGTPTSVKALHGSPPRRQTRNIKPDQIRMTQSANVVEAAQPSSYSLDRYVNAPPERYEKLVTLGGSCDQTCALPAKEVSKTKPAKRKA
ncbi:hypothetical protein CERZMDRAFT_92663 [Cercospora zeae-maydis SCOH1-5]|uniref:Uncharacterized protein n=1 Tax=Cercospora zeae-maydis SCOH1-5 TaxID=717836 RepID=A0A6A6FXS1_9PEZI|nr:hypothetical protein CERZMDRAFT_92663 [Cercospora zeae-maydis SCOH1-5]